MLRVIRPEAGEERETFFDHEFFLVPTRRFASKISLRINNSYSVVPFRPLPANNATNSQFSDVNYAEIGQRSRKFMGGSEGNIC
jgi:hypothetical protein